MSERLEKALEVNRKAEKRYGIAKNMFFVYLLIVTLFSAVQTVIISQQVKDSLEVNRANGAANHQRTQEYVKCIAITLLKPVQERSTVDFNNCTKTEAEKSSSVVNPNDTPQQNAVTNTPQPTQQAPQIIIKEKSSDESTGAAPPDPDSTPPGTGDPAETSRVFTILDELLREVDESRVGGTLKQLGL